jgi:myosin heavy subunit
MLCSSRFVNLQPGGGAQNQMIFWDPAECVVAQGKASSQELSKDDAYIRQHLYTPASVTRVLDGGELMARTKDGEVHRMRADSLKRVAPQDLQGVTDILQLNDFSEMSLLHTLRVRYERDEVYSFVGPILISINPYKWIPDLYEETTMLKYHGAQASSAAGKASPPHLFCVADAAYAALISGSGGKPLNQSIIISGESGAVSACPVKHQSSL